LVYEWKAYTYRIKPIKEYIRKYMLAIIAVMMWKDLELNDCKYLDQKLDTGYMIFLPAKIMIQKQIARIGGEESHL